MRRRPDAAAVRHLAVCHSFFRLNVLRRPRPGVTVANAHDIQSLEDAVMRSIVVSVVLSLIVNVAPCVADENASPFVGRWITNFTKVDPDSRKSSILQITRDDEEEYAQSETTLYTDGHSSCAAYQAKYDGKSYSVQGMSIPSTVIIQKSQSTRHMDFESVQGAHWTSDCEISPDRKTLTCDEAVDGPDRGTLHTTLYIRNVYVRE